MTTEEFIQKARKIHGDKYNYSKVNYINNRTKVCIICPEHGEFWQRPYDHVKNHECPKCKGYHAKRNKAKNEFVSKSISIHGNRYDYSKVEYKNNYTPVCIICHEHGEFFQKPFIHLEGSGCKKCGIIKSKSFSEKLIKYSKSQNSKAKNEFIKKANLINGCKYDYSKTKYENANTKVCIICQKHGEFWQRPYDHLTGHGCPICSESHGEKEIRNYLEKHKIKYEKEKTFEGLIGVKGFSLRFDFYLPEHNACIEFDGIQHRKYIKGMQTEQQFLDLQEHDRRKNEFCENNGIKLIRISSISSILNKLKQIGLCYE